MKNIERIHLIRDLKNQGLSFEKIGEKLGITKQRASIIFHSDINIIKTPRAKPITKWSSYYKKFAEDYRNNLSSLEIAKKYNCSTRTVTKGLEEEGIKPNKKRGRKPLNINKLI